jgi:hypothetical protein
MLATDLSAVRFLQLGIGNAVPGARGAQGRGAVEAGLVGVRRETRCALGRRGLAHAVTARRGLCGLRPRRRQQRHRHLHRRDRRSGGGAPGTSAGANGYGTGAETNLTVTVVPGASVTGTTGSGIIFDTGTVTNFGTISGAGIGIEGVTSAVVTNSGTIMGGFSGIAAGTTANVVNSGSIIAIASGQTSRGVEGATVNVSNSGSIVAIALQGGPDFPPTASSARSSTSATGAASPQPATLTATASMAAQSTFSTAGRFRGPVAGQASASERLIQPKWKRL